MIAAGTGLVVGGMADDAAREASRQAIERSGTDRADIALVFVTGDAHARSGEALHAVRRATGAPVVLGCSGTGILTEQREVEGELAVAVLAVRCDRLVATPFSFDSHSSDSSATASSRPSVAATSSTTTRARS